MELLILSLSLIHISLYLRDRFKIFKVIKDFENYISIEKKVNTNIKGKEEIKTEEKKSIESLYGKYRLRKEITDNDLLLYRITNTNYIIRPQQATSLWECLSSMNMEPGRYGGQDFDSLGKAYTHFLNVLLKDT